MAPGREVAPSSPDSAAGAGGAAALERPAEYLERHPRVTQVWYSGLAGTRGHEIARAQWVRFGGMPGFALESREARDAFLDRVELRKPWVSLGDAASLVHDAHSENRIRMSVGLEDCADIERDLEQAIG